MAYLSRTLLLSAVLLTSCGGSTKSDKLSVDEVDALIGAPMVPVQTALTAMFIMPFLGSFDVECPAITELEGGGYSAEGGCTDEDGQEWSGSMLWEGADITWTAFEMPGMSIDGTQRIVMNDLTSDLNVSFSDEVSSHTATYTNYTVAGFMEFYTAVFSEEPYSLDFSGQLSVDDLGDFETTGSVQDDLTCDMEPTSGGFTLDGEFTFELIFDGGTNCDGCMSWTADDQKGTKCYEDGDTGSEGDTGR
jgi:hypothetical protein